MSLNLFCRPCAYPEQYSPRARPEEHAEGCDVREPWERERKQLDDLIGAMTRVAHAAERIAGALESKPAFVCQGCGARRSENEWRASGCKLVCACGAGAWEVK